MSAVAEGVSTAVVLSELAARQGIELTVCGEVSRVVRGEIDAHRAYRGLEVEAGYEADPG
jgi:glycerol-3-phosphate dehydrogenase